MRNALDCRPMCVDYISVSMESWSNNSRTQRSLYERANGYNYEATKIFMPANRAKPVYAKYIEHIPPDVTACIFWLKNRDPQHWPTSAARACAWQDLISDWPMSEEEWARERATVIDEQTNNEISTSSPSPLPTTTSPSSSPPTSTPEARFGDGREERHLEAAKKLASTPPLTTPMNCWG